MIRVGRRDNQGLCHICGNLMQCCHLSLRLSVTPLLIIDKQCNGKEITGKNLFCWTSLRILTNLCWFWTLITLDIYSCERRRIVKYDEQKFCNIIMFQKSQNHVGPLGSESSYSESHSSSSMSACETTQQDRLSPTPRDTTTTYPQKPHLLCANIYIVYIGNTRRAKRTITPFQKDMPKDRLYPL